MRSTTPLSLALSWTLTSAIAVAQPQPPQGASRPTGGLSLQALLAAQLRFSVSAPSEGAAVTGPVEFRRVRPGLRLTGLDGRLSGQLVLNTTPSSLELIDLFVEYRALPRLSVRAGQMKVPFTAYRMQPFTELAFVDWALVTRYFGGERQIGVEVHDRAADARTEYALGVFNGTTLRAAHGQGVAPVYGDPIENLSDLRSYRAPDAPHPELVGRFAWHHGARRPSGLQFVVAQGLGADLGMGVCLDLDPTPAHDLRAAFAPEITVRDGPFSASVTGYLGVSPRTEQLGDAALFGALAEASVFVTRYVSVALRYARVERSQALLDDARARAARLIRTAPDAQSAAVRRQYGDVGRTRAEDELTLGATVYLHGRAVAWQNDLGWLTTYRDDGDRHELRWRTQLQLAL